MAKILVVDDQESILKTADAILKRLGHEVVLAKDGYEALEKMQNSEFDIVITDAVMPGISGWDLAKSLRFMQKKKPLSIIMMTARNDRRDVERAIQVHIDDYIVKPLDQDVLMAKLKTQILKLDKNVPKPELEVKESAETTLKFEIIALSEAGVKIQAGFSAPTGMRMPVVNCPFFQKMGLPPQNLRVLTCAPKGGAFYINAEFVDLNSADLDKVRAWLATTDRAS